MPLLNDVSLGAIPKSETDRKIDSLVKQINTWGHLINNEAASSPGQVSSVNGYTGVVTLTKSDIGLSNVNNTSDVNKPVSTAQQTALDLKVNSSDLNAAWATWSPTLGGVTVGNGTTTYAKYKQIGTTIHFRLKFTLGSTSAITGAITFTLPVDCNSEYAQYDSFNGRGSMNDSDTNIFPCTPTRHTTASVCRLRTENVAFTYNVYDTTSSTIPFSWGTSDYFQVSGSYEI